MPGPSAECRQSFQQMVATLRDGLIRAQEEAVEGRPGQGDGAVGTDWIGVRQEVELPTKAGDDL